MEKVRFGIIGVGNMGSGHSKNLLAGKVENGVLRVTGELHYYKVLQEAQIVILPDDGEVIAHGRTLELKNATAATVIVAVGTNFRLESRVFLENDPKKKLAPYPAPHEKVTKILNAAKGKKYSELLARHLADYCPIMARADVDLGGKVSDLPTDGLLDKYKKGERDLYLEIHQGVNAHLPCDLGKS